MTNTSYTVNESIVQADTVQADTVQAVGITFRKTEYGEWKCIMFNNVQFIPLKGDEPNWFWRWTQHLILGHKWIKEKRHN